MNSRNSRSREWREALRPAGLGAWLLTLAAGTAVLWAVRDTAHEAHMALAYLLIVLGGSARHGRVVGLVLAVVSFLSFNFFLLPPYYTLAIEDPLDWWVLVAFLITGTVAAQLFHRTQSARATAERRTREVERLSALGAESLSVPRAADAVKAIARIIRAELPVRSVEIRMRPEEGGESVVIARASGDSSPTPREGFPDASSITGDARVFVSPDGRQTRVPLGADLASTLAKGTPPRSISVPLAVRGANLGALTLWDPDGIRLDPAQARFADTLGYYAALAVERVRLSAQAEHVEALREADRLKDAVLASVSHDLRTPLTTIRALASEMRDTGDERSAIIEEEADRLNRIVTDLLDMSRIRSGSLPLDVELIAAEDLVGAMLQRLGGLAGPDRIRVSLPGDGTLLVGRFDFVHALRALGNLVENALRHAPAGEPVEVEVSEDADDLVFTVLDRGPGVPAGLEERIFEPFVHGDRTSERLGTGLGLAIARSVAEAQGGAVSYRKRPGGGSIFELRLPLGHMDLGSRR